MSYHEVAEKFRGCAGFAQWPFEKTEAVVEFVRILDTAPDVRRLTALVSSRG